jgi:hypothetical protein
MLGMLGMLGIVGIRMSVAFIPYRTVAPLDLSMPTFSLAAGKDLKRWSLLSSVVHVRVHMFMAERLVYGYMDMG